MIYKSVLYKKEQDDIIDKLVDILGIDDNNNSITLYEIDNNSEMCKDIMDLLPDIKKYYSLSTVKGISSPENSKRPYLTIIKQILKNKYMIYNSDGKVYIESGRIRTTKYVFLKKKDNI